MGLDTEVSGLRVGFCVLCIRSQTTQTWKDEAGEDELPIKVVGKLRCTKCEKDKFETDFHKERGNTGRKGRTCWCKDCCKEYTQQDRRTNPEKFRRWDRKNRLKLYGLTPQEYEEMVERQNGVCAICGFPESAGKLLGVDHCHRTGKVRQLLCSNCNNGLGKFKDDLVLLRKATGYLERHAA